MLTEVEVFTNLPSEILSRRDCKEIFGQTTNFLKYHARPGFYAKGDIVLFKEVVSCCCARGESIGNVSDVVAEVSEAPSEEVGFIKNSVVLDVSAERVGAVITAVLGKIVGEG